MNVWFGESWGAPLCEETTHVAVPVGAACGWCGEPIAATDSGIGSMRVDEQWAAARVYYHVECFMRSVLGSVGHQLKVCSCYGGPYEDAPEMSIRDAARAAWDVAQYRRDPTLVMWTIFDRPLDFPNHYVVRAFDIVPAGVTPHPLTCLYTSLEEARLDCQANGADTCLPREPTDEPGIIETWL